MPEVRLPNKNRKLEYIKCLCGCGKDLNKYDERNRLRKYIKNHSYNIKHSKQFKKGDKPFNKGTKGLMSAWNKGLKGYNSGENSHFWRGGITEEHRRIRQSLEMKLWRVAVFMRDDYTCQICGDRNGNGKEIILHADHIKPFALYPELRFAIDNGRTLCIDCHKKTGTYGRSFMYRQGGIN